MAFQISGTEVISNSRGLNNIASVDATTAASISAAGVGGGGTVDFTATGAIASGDVVGLRSDGTVEVISGTSQTESLGTRTTVNSSNSVNYAAVFDATNNKVINGTPLINSMKQMLIVLTTVSFDCLPNAKIIPIGREHTIPLTPRITVNINPPKRLYSILWRPK